MQGNKKREQLNFEEAMKRLEEIVKKLDEGEVPLEESVKIFEEGVELVNFCKKKLQEVENKIEIVLKKKDGEYEKNNFEERNKSKE